MRIISLKQLILTFYFKEGIGISYKHPTGSIIF